MVFAAGKTDMPDTQVEQVTVRNLPQTKLIQPECKISTILCDDW